MIKKEFGIVTIGQIPRPDISHTVEKLLGLQFNPVIAGALDELTIKDIPEVDIKKYLLMTSMKDDSGNRVSIKVSRGFLVPLIQKRINELENEVDVIMIWCAGRFPEFKSKAIIVRPSEVLKGTIEGIISKGKIGVVYPGEEQLIWAEEEWKRDKVEVYADTLIRIKSREEAVKELAQRLSRKDLDIVLLNCASFGQDMKTIIRSVTAKPVIQANVLALNVVRELLE